MSRPNVVVLFTKPAVAGRVKTRMTSHYSPEQACALHKALLRDVASQILPQPEASYRLEIAWAVADEEHVPRLEAEVSGSRRLQGLLAAARASGTLGESRQRGRDLGERLFHALNAARHTGAQRVAAIGSDHPELDAAAVERAFAGLDEDDLLIMPTDDGGYSLLAVRCECLDPQLFAGIQWSSPRVFEQTLQRAASLGLSVACTEVTYDIDEPADLHTLMRRLREAGDGDTEFAVQDITSRQTGRRAVARATVQWFLDQEREDSGSANAEARVADDSRTTASEPRRGTSR